MKHVVANGPMPYASRTGTRRNLARLKAAGWGLMVSAKGAHRTEGFERYCYDNGAWSAHTSCKMFDETAFLRGYEAVAEGADFAVLPDIVAGGKRSLDFSLTWLERLWPTPCPLLLAVQDGMQCADVVDLIGPELGIFLGGTSEWKENSMQKWGQLARQLGAYFHVGRVNTRRRIALCVAAGAHSFDGSGPSRYVKELAYLDDARHQKDLFT